jgi:hypothetical protein
MPVIMTKGWSDYEHHCSDLIIDSSLKFSPWQTVHPGKMFKPSYESLKNRMVFASRNVQLLMDEYFENANNVHQEYGWEKIISNWFDEVEARLVV